MNRSFYQFALTFRGGSKADQKAIFAEAMFLDHSFPKTDDTFDSLSKYIEEKADDFMSAITFDELWNLYEESRF